MPSYQELALDLAAHTSPLRLRVNGVSMVPLLKSGDYVTVEPVPYPSLCVGDVIAFRHGRDTITHRIVALTPQGALTLGDNFHKLDPIVAPEMILGRVVAVEKRGRSYSFSTGLWPATHRLMAQLGWLMTRPNHSKWFALFPRIFFWFVRYITNLFFFLK